MQVGQVEKEEGEVQYGGAWLCFLGLCWCSWSLLSWALLMFLVMAFMGFVGVYGHVLLVSTIVHVIGSWILMGNHKGLIMNGITCF